MSIQPSYHLKLRRKNYFSSSSNNITRSGPIGPAPDSVRTDDALACVLNHGHVIPHLVQNNLTLKANISWWKRVYKYVNSSIFVNVGLLRISSFIYARISNERFVLETRTGGALVHNRDVYVAQKQMYARDVLEPEPVMHWEARADRCSPSIERLYAFDRLRATDVARVLCFDP